MIQTKETTIKEVKEVKSGVGKNGAWTLYSVIDQDGQRYGTFQAEPWKTFMTKGEKCTITFEEQPGDKIDPKTGNPYVNRNIVDPQKKEKATGGWSPDIVEKVFVGLRSIFGQGKDLNDKLDLVLKKLSELEVAEEDAIAASVPEVKKDDVPF